MQCPTCSIDGESLLAQLTRANGVINDQLAKLEQHRKRAYVCAFCGEAFSVASEEPTNEELEIVVSHEKTCAHNPYLEEIRGLEESIRYMNGVIDALR